MKIDLRALLEKQSPVMISLYMPTHRSAPDNEQDPIRFKNLLNDVRKRIAEYDCDCDADKLLAKAEALQKDYEFWQHTKDGLAVFIDENDTEVIQLGVNLPEQVTVSDHFHILPLINYFDIFTNYYVIDLSRDRFNLYHFDSEGFELMDLGEIATRFDDLFDDRDVRDSNVSRTDGAATNLHSHQTASQTQEKETEKYMRYIGNELNNYFRSKHKYPIIVFGTTENVSKFADFNKNQLHIHASIDKPFSSMDESQAMDALREKLLPRYIKEVKAEIENLKVALGQDEEKGSENISRIGQEAKNGRIKTLIINQDYKEISLDEIDKIVSDVILAGGEVITIHPEHVDFDLGVGAVYRF